MPYCPGVLGTNAILKPSKPPGGCEHPAQRRRKKNAIHIPALLIVAPVCRQLADVLIFVRLEEKY
jgi:hypothetical protein